MKSVLLITPPFTQLNTPYPATAYLKGFLDEQGVDCHQQDLGIELFRALFTAQRMAEMFALAQREGIQQCQEVFDQRDDYLRCLDGVVSYLSQPEVTAAYQILRPGYLPRAHRWEDVDEDLDWAFGNLGILDKAKHYATLFVEELGDFVRGNIDEFFAFTKYAEQISASASSFDDLNEYLKYDPTPVEEVMLELLEKKIQEVNPQWIGFTVPFPGNLFAALRCGQYIKAKHPKLSIVMGGGYCNTELRSITEPRVFDYVDYITLDDGEGPIMALLKDEGTETFERTFARIDGAVTFLDHKPNTIYHHRDLPVPSYGGLKLDNYLSFLDVMNPMHRLWSDGRWNKLTISHGCYWKQCSFCDVSLDYIGNYQNTTADTLVDKIEALIAETGTRGFHFVDEAAPPKMMKELAQRLVERRVDITWWTNIRFEKTFDDELCALLARSGCIAVTGGLEVASDRLLEKMKKGVDIGQVARVTKAFANNDIMVHAYLMYGFPTQTEQETIDSLEVVRQLFINGCIHSAFWHRFTTTVHSPVGINPEEFGITITGPEFGGFAQNDLEHHDPQGADHAQFGVGLAEALNAFLSGVGLEEDLQEWFDQSVPDTTHSVDYISNYLAISEPQS